MKRTGNILKQARENSGLSLHEIGLHIKINNKTLKAIEDGDTAKLPAKTFLRGFVKSYATFLKLNIDEVMATFQEEMGSTKPNISVSTPNQEASKSESATMAPIPPPENDKKNIENRNENLASASNSTVKQSQNLNQDNHVNEPGEEQIKLQGDLVYKIEKKRNALATTVAGIAVALVLVVIGLNKIIEKYAKEIELNQIAVQEPIDTTELNQQLAEATTDNQPVNQVAVEQNNLQNNKVVNEPLTQPTSMVGDPSIANGERVQEAVNTSLPQSSAVIPLKDDSNSLIETKIESDRNKPVELIVEATSDVEVQYSTLSGKVEVVKLKADQIHTFKSKQGLKVSISDAGAVNLILNGRDIGTPGGKGKQIKLSY